MELEIIEQAKETELETVSTEIVPEVEEWKAPESKEALDELIKAEANRTYTKALKDLGVKSIKEFKEMQAKLESDKQSLETIVQEKETYANEIKDISAKYEKLIQESILNDLNIEKDYREDLIKLAKDRVTDEKQLPEVLKEMIEGKYKYTVANRSPIKMGIEKTEKVDQESSISDSLAKKYPWLKG